MRALDQLDLTDEQRDQLRVTFHESMAGDLGRLRQEQRERQRELARLIADPTTEESAIVSAVRAAAEREEKLALAQHQLHVALFGILSEEQREEAQALIAELPRRARGDGRGKRRNAPGSE
jgi:Spy/CpxP family protein refolding chaperone